jgi:hypothetical protein
VPFLVPLIDSSERNKDTEQRRWVKREGEKLTLVLRNGVELPVAKANNRALREAGWV